MAITLKRLRQVRGAVPKLPQNHPAVKKGRRFAGVAAKAAKRYGTAKAGKR